MKQKYIKNDTQKSVFAEQLHHVKRKTKSKKYEDQEEVVSTENWRIEHEDGFVTSLTNEKFLKRYTKA